MKFLADCKKFLAAVKAAGRFSMPHSTVSAFECVKIGAREAHLYAEGNDFGTGARLAFPAEVEEDSPALLPPRVVEKMLAGADGVVRVSIQNGTARVWTGSSEFSAEVPSADDFPAWPDAADDAARFTIGADELARALGSTIPAAGGDERPATNAVHAEVSQADGLVLVATNGFQMHVARETAVVCSVPKDAEDGRVLSDVRLDAARALLRLVAGYGGVTVAVDAAQGRLLAQTPGAFSFFALNKANAPFPRWRSCIPEKLRLLSPVVVPGKVLAAALSQFWKIGAGEARLEFTEDGIGLSATVRRDEDDVALSMRRFVPAGYATALGEPVNVTPSVLASVLLATGTPDAILHRVESADTTLVVKAADFGREFQAVVMLCR